MKTFDRSDAANLHGRTARHDRLQRKTYIDVLLKLARPDDHWTVRVLFAFIASLRIAMPVTVILMGGEAIVYVGRHL